MNKLSNKLLLMAGLLFTINCDGISGTSEKASENGTKEENVLPSSLAGVEIDTLCVYQLRRMGKIDKTHIFQNETHITSFLESTGYVENDTAGLTQKRIAHQPDFKKWTYFAFAGANYGNTIDISYGKDTVTINYVEYIPTLKPCVPLSPCVVPAAPVGMVTVYFIPFTEKTIEFVQTTKQIGENNH